MGGNGCFGRNGGLNGVDGDGNFGSNGCLEGVAEAVVLGVMVA